MNQSEQRHAVFLDLNGTLVLPIQVEKPSEHWPIPGAARAVALLCDAGFLCPVITVQSRIEKGTFSETEFRDWFRSFSTELAGQRAFLEGPYICPHRYAMPCGCKKAGGALYRRAAAELKIDLASSFVVGDSVEDIEAARLLGCKSVLVRTGWHVSPDVGQLCDHLAEDVLSASHWIVGR